MKASDLIKREILKNVSSIIDRYREDHNQPNPIPSALDSPEVIAAMIEKLGDTPPFDDYFNDAANDFRDDFSHETGIGDGGSLHYESKGVARQIGEHWVGWTYWYGGGKYGDPDSIEWIDDAVFLDATEKQITTYEFKELKG